MIFEPATAEAINDHGDGDEVGAEIARSLDHVNVPEREKQEVSGGIVARKDELVNP